MSTHRRDSDHLRAAADTPLPGFYGVITCQLNVTRYQATKLSKWVLVVREPSSQVELYRSFVDVKEWEDARAELRVAIEEALSTVAFLQDGYRHLEE